MKNFKKIAFIFLVLTVGISYLVGCSNSSNQANVSSNENPVNSSIDSAKKDNETEFPAVSDEIMQADLKGLDGENFKLEDYKGKTILINFWATWCGPCRAEMPELVKLREKYKDKGFEVIGVNSDPEDSAEAIKAFSEKMNLTYKVAQSDLGFFDQFLKISKFDGIPQSFLIDGKGRLRGVFLGGGPNTIEKVKENVSKLMGEG